jgi:hypothetical protein
MYRAIPNLHGKLIKVAPLDTIPIFKNGNFKNAACQAGLRYERKILEKLRQKYKEQVCLKPWFKYSYLDDSDQIVHTVCSPDAVIILPEKKQIIIVEIKIRLTAVAYFQLKNLYYPILFMINGGGYKYTFLNIIKWYDPYGMENIRDWRMLKDLADLTPNITQMAVHIWR